MSESSFQSPIRVFLLLRHRLLRDALNRVFRRRVDFLVVGCRKEEDCSPRAIVESECDVLVLDFLDTRWLPTKLQLEAGDAPLPKALVIGMKDDSDQFLAAVRGGATGYLLDDASTADVVRAVRATFRGEAVCSPKFCASLFQTLSQTAAAGAAQAFTAPALNLRQQRLVALIASGMTNKEIASHLHLSEFTIKNHIHRIMKQFNAGSRSQVVHTILSLGYRLNGIAEHPS